MLCLPLLCKSLLLVYIHPLNIVVNGISALCSPYEDIADNLQKLDFSLSRKNVLWKPDRQTAVYPIRKYSRVVQSEQLIFQCSQRATYRNSYDLTAICHKLLSQ